MHSELANLVSPGSTVAFGDGYGAPLLAREPLAAVARQQGGVRLLLGWVPFAEAHPDPAAFREVRAVMGGWGLRRLIDAGQVKYAPVRLSAVPALLHGPWRPDLLVTTVVPVEGGYAFGSEVSWQRAAVEAGATVAAVVSRAAPRCDSGRPLPADRLVLLAESDEPPATLPEQPVRPEHEAIAASIADRIGDSARLQVGPGAVGAALLRELRAPVCIDSGLLPESVVDLDERGLLLGEPVATYLVGGPRLYEWANGRRLLHPVEHTHDLGRLSNEPFFAVNTAVEVDLDGQINVEGTEQSTLGGLGGHPDYAAAATRSVGGLSIIAVPSEHAGKSTLVTRLSRPASTSSHDVDVVVTERGTVDLRGLSRAERRKSLRGLWASVREIPTPDFGNEGENSA